jgi:hypothetical protein
MESNHRIRALLALALATWRRRRETLDSIVHISVKTISSVIFDAVTDYINRSFISYWLGMSMKNVRVFCYD